MGSHREPLDVSAGISNKSKRRAPDDSALTPLTTPRECWRMPAPIVVDTSRRDWTADEIQALPEDGNRYEVIDGELFVTPAPSDRRQDAAGYSIIA